MKYYVIPLLFIYCSSLPVKMGKRKSFTRGKDYFSETRQADALENAQGTDGRIILRQTKHRCSRCQYECDSEMCYCHVDTGVEMPDLRIGTSDPTYVKVDGQYVLVGIECVVDDYFDYDSDFFYDE